ncbi:hypothetical protein FXO37_30869 [Capsicum annuum]|nr:hypothetical protein FXO37_30869 [Capsicum annuum]
MATKNSSLFSLGISQIETQKGVPARNQVVNFTSDNFGYTEECFSKNRSEYCNDPKKLKNLRQAFAAKNQEFDMQMEDQEEVEHLLNQKLNEVDLANPLTFGQTDLGANVAQVVSVQQEAERTSPTEILYEFDDFSTPSNADMLKKMMLEADLDDIKSCVKTYVAHSPVHESEKDILNREGNPSQSLNEDNTKAKSDNVVEDAGQSFKVDDNEGGVDVCLKEAESAYTDKVQEEDRHNTAAEIDEGIRDELLKVSFHWVLAFIVLKKKCIRVYDSLKAYAEYLSDGHQIPSSEFDPEMYRTRYTSLLWGYGLNKASNEYVDDNQDPPRPKRTFIPSEITEMIDVEM